MQGQHKILNRTWTTLALSRVLPCVELRSIHLSQALCASHPGRLPYRRHSRSESTSNWSAGSSLMMTALCDTNVVIYLKVSSWNFFLFPSFFPFTALGVLKQLPRCNTSLQLDPPQRTDCLEKRINKAKFSKPLTFSLPPSRKRAWSVLNHRRHVTPFCCRRFLFSFHSGLWMLSTLKQSELINTSL